MPRNRRHIPAAVKQQRVTIAIAQVTHASYRTVNRVLRLSPNPWKAVVPVYLQQQMFRTSFAANFLMPSFE
ncbi:hypothetical protein K503DRAFT_772680 [Rhizopogon vinicolor AM-OR11-026]|uniref:Uncharacterized protein n=1 Tax=Rhizopogon vinicolor AM-OR11-026 TaxID=1314800 RepID=A0A1B7MUJ4_9AGAM|nr:hypothetical protein K503DRAFT_772680 [Rhizopogon vinicolor AM-OR11-026]